jgi:uncharacterized protein
MDIYADVIENEGNIEEAKKLYLEAIKRGHKNSFFNYAFLNEVKIKFLKKKFRNLKKIKNI